MILISGIQVHEWPTTVNSNNLAPFPWSLVKPCLKKNNQPESNTSCTCMYSGSWLNAPQLPVLQLPFSVLLSSAQVVSQ